MFLVVSRSLYAGALVEPFLLVGNRDIIQQISLDGEEAIVILNDTDYDVIGVDFDSRLVESKHVSCVVCLNSLQNKIKK